MEPQRKCEDCGRLLTAEDDTLCRECEAEYDFLDDENEYDYTADL